MLSAAKQHQFARLWPQGKRENTASTARGLVESLGEISVETHVMAQKMQHNGNQREGRNLAQATT